MNVTMDVDVITTTRATMILPSRSFMSAACEPIPPAVGGQGEHPERRQTGQARRSAIAHLTKPITVAAFADTSAGAAGGGFGIAWPGSSRQHGQHVGHGSLRLVQPDLLLGCSMNAVRPTPTTSCDLGHTPVRDGSARAAPTFIRCDSTRSSPSVSSSAVLRRTRCSSS